MLNLLKNSPAICYTLEGNLIDTFVLRLENYDKQFEETHNVTMVLSAENWHQFNVTTLMNENEKGEYFLLKNTIEIERGMFQVQSTTINTDNEYDPR